MKLSEHKDDIQEMINLCKNIRQMYGLSQKDLAIEFGVTLNDIQNFEYGKSNNAIILYKYFMFGEKENENK